MTFASISGVVGVQPATSSISLTSMKRNVATARARSFTDMLMTGRPPRGSPRSHQDGRDINQRRAQKQEDRPSASSVARERDSASRWEWAEEVAEAHATPAHARDAVSARRREEKIR